MHPRGLPGTRPPVSWCLEVVLSQSVVYQAFGCAELEVLSSVLTHLGAGEAEREHHPLASCGQQPSGGDLGFLLEGLGEQQLRPGGEPWS